MIFLNHTYRVPIGVNKNKAISVLLEIKATCAMLIATLHMQLSE